MAKVLKAEQAKSDHEAMAIMKSANDAHAAAIAQNDDLRSRLPTGLRRLTAGYAMNTYWYAANRILSVSIPAQRLMLLTVCAAGLKSLNASAR